MIKNYFSNLDQEKKVLLKGLLEEVMKWNSKINLVSFKNEKELLVKHFLDSAMLLSFRAISATELSSRAEPEGRSREISLELTGSKVLDLGTGGGFPGLVLSILRPEVDFTLMDATRKKIEVLMDIVGKLGLKNVDFVVGRAEELAHKNNFRESFDVVVARAVARLPVLLELACGFVKVGGRFIAYKGPSYKEELEMSSRATAILGFKFEEVKEYELPEGFGKRALVIYRKELEASEKYPRRVGVPGKRPLGMGNF